LVEKLEAARETWAALGFFTLFRTTSLKIVGAGPSCSEIPKVHGGG
jgi:hypothetical protein